MKLRGEPPIHLTYCLNVHPGETWDENVHAIRAKACAVKKRVAPAEPFGLGLRLSHEAARQLLGGDAIERLREFLDTEGLYTFTINGFPYGRFHGTAVKENVYAPDWRTQERLDYTADLAEILAALLPAGVTGSISTVPCSYKSWIRTEDDVDRMAENLAKCVHRFDRIRERTGREIHLGLEPEPDCYLETTGETLSFITEKVLQVGRDALCKEAGCTRAVAEEKLRRHVGVCFDACHLALQYEDLAESRKRYVAASVRISKVHLSAALRSRVTDEARRALADFCDPVYLHQVKVKSETGAISAFNDLPAFLERDGEAGGECRVHFHVPLYFAEYGSLTSTATLLDEAFFTGLFEGEDLHLEIETYTFAVLPAELRALEITESIAREYEWVLARVKPLL